MYFPLMARPFCRKSSHPATEPRAETDAEVPLVRIGGLCSLRSPSPAHSGTERRPGHIEQLRRSSYGSGVRYHGGPQPADHPIPLIEFDDVRPARLRR